MNTQDDNRYKRPDLRDRYERQKQNMQSMSEQKVRDRYTGEVLKLRIFHQFGRRSKQFIGYPDTLVMNLCRQILEHRSLPLPSVIFQEKEESNTATPSNSLKS